MTKIPALMCALAALALVPCASAQTWSEVGDAGQNGVSVAQVPTGSGALTQISGTVGAANDVDVYCINIVDAANFDATTVGSVAFDSQLFLFDIAGKGVVHNDDFGGLDSRITSDGVTSNGTYFIAITAFNADPQDSSGSNIFTFNTIPGTTQQRLPDPAAGPLAQWTTSSSTGTYTINLIGAEFCAPGTFGVPGVNDLVVNGLGSGQQSCILVDAPRGIPLTLNATSHPNSPITLSTAGACAPGTIPITAFYKFDLDIFTHVLLFDGTGGLIPANPLTPFLRTTAAGTFSFSVSNSLPVGNVLAVQMGFVNPAFSVGLGVSQAHEITSTPSVMTTSYTLADDGNTAHSLAVPIQFYGVTYNSLFLNSNGYVTFNAGSSDFTETMPEFFDGWNNPPNPGVALIYSDLNPGGTTSGATYDVLENFVTNEVEVQFNNQFFWGGGESAGSVSATFGSSGPNSVLLDYAAFTPATIGTDNVIIGVTNGDASIGTDVDFSNTLGTGLSLVLPYSSIGTPESIGETIPMNTAIPFATVEFTDPTGTGTFTVN